MDNRAVLTMIIIKRAVFGSLNQSRFNAKQRTEHHVDFTEALVKQPLEDQNRDK